jgi:hypothetical protein
VLSVPLWLRRHPTPTFTFQLFPSLTTCRGSAARLLIEKGKQKAHMPDMAFGVHTNNVMNAINERNESGGHSNLWLIAAGALAGALAGYALRTPRGRHVFDEVIVMLDDFATGCARFSQACARAQSAASTSWNALTGGITSKSIRMR